MKRVLVTGMSGTGKSTLLAELAARGYPTVDTDHPDAGGDFFEVVDGERLWRTDRVEELLSREYPQQLLFVQGTTSNQGTFYPRFEHVVLLSAPADVMVRRLRTRTNNVFGSRPGEEAAVLDDLAHVEPLLRAAATLEVVTTVGVDVVADVVLAHVL